MRLNYYRFPESIPESQQIEYGADDGVVMGCTVTYAKKLLRMFGGCAWTDHCERDGGVFEVTDITLSGNNSKFKYNHHL